MRTLIVAVFCAVVATMNCFAQMTVRDFREKMASGDSTSIRLTQQLILGMGAGIQIANVFEQRVKAPALYCAPTSLALNVDNLVDIIRRTIANAPPGGVSDDDQIALVLLSGLAMTFPCTPK